MTGMKSAEARIAPSFISLWTSKFILISDIRALDLIAFKYGYCRNFLVGQKLVIQFPYRR